MVRNKLSEDKEKHFCRYESIYPLINCYEQENKFFIITYNNWAQKEDIEVSFCPFCGKKSPRKQ